MSFVAQPLQSGLFSFFPTWKGAIVCTPLMTMVIDDYQAAILIYRLSYKPWLLLRYRTERTGHDRIPIIIGIWCIPNYKLQKNIANNFCYENVQLFTTSAGCCTNKRNYYFLTFLCMATVCKQYAAINSNSFLSIFYAQQIRLLRKFRNQNNLRKHL